MILLIKKNRTPPLLTKPVRQSHPQLNPEHTVPTIKDGDFVLWESRAIMAFLVNKYGKGDLYYPKDPMKRAVVDQRLHFDMGTLYQRFSAYYYPQVLEQKPADPEKYQKIDEALAFLEKFLDGQKYAAGNEITIADFTLATTISTFVDGGANFSIANYPNIQRWYADCKKDIPHYEKSLPSLEAVKGFFAKIGAPKAE